MSKAGDPDGFGEWAFGDAWWDYIILNDSMLLFNAWNELHGEELLLHPEGIIERDLPKMVAIFKLTTNKPKVKNAKPSSIKKGNKPRNKKKLNDKISKRVQARRAGANENSNKTTKTRRKTNG